MVLECIVQNNLSEFVELSLRKKIHSDDFVAMLKYGRDEMILHYYQCSHSKAKIAKKLRKWVLLYDNLVVFQAFDLISYKIDKSILKFNVCKDKTQIARFLLEVKPKTLADPEYFLGSLRTQNEDFTRALLDKIKPRKLFSLKALDYLLEQKNYPMFSELLSANRIPKRFLKYLQTKMLEDGDIEYIHILLNCKPKLINDFAIAYLLKKSRNYPYATLYESPYCRYPVIRFPFREDGSDQVPLLDRYGKNNKIGQH
ncbi:hypothetical protein ENBRE01_2714, partial [Enteropsectra breve]